MITLFLNLSVPQPVPPSPKTESQAHTLLDKEQEIAVGIWKENRRLVTFKMLCAPASLSSLCCGTLTFNSSKVHFHPLQCLGV